MKRISLVVLSIVLAGGVAFAQTDTTATAPAAPAAPPTAPAASDAVKRAVLTTGVVEREPVDEITTLSPPADRIFFFTEIVGMEGRTITHRWLHNGQTVAEVPIAIGGARWRCYSIKTMAPEVTGTWSVEVVDDAGNKIREASFTYAVAPQAAPQAAPQ